MCIIFSNEPKYCACFYVNNVLYVYNCIHEKAIKLSCNLVILSSFWGGVVLFMIWRLWVQTSH